MDSSKVRRIAIGLCIVIAAYVGWGIFSAVIGVPGPYFSSLRKVNVPRDENESLRSTPIAITHSVSKNVHTYAGVVNTPSCSQAGSGLRTVGTDPVRVQILLTFTPVQGACAEGQVIGRPFSVSYTAPEASKSAPIFDGISVNGVAVAVTVKEE